MKKWIAIVLIMVFIAGVTPASQSKAAESNYITTRNYIIRLVKAAKVKVNGTSVNDYINAALESGILLKEEKSLLKKKVTKADAAVYGNRADELLNGTTFNAALCKQISTKKRISDLSKIEEEKRSAVIKMFSKGIMVGESNGAYAQSRSFHGDEYLTTSAANTIATRIQDKSKRKVLSRDGQLTRTTKLPKNYKDFEYILESFPNKFYEVKFEYEGVKKGDGSKMKEFDDYIRPVNMRKSMFNTKLGYKMSDVMDLYSDDWCKKVKTNMKCRFNVDYRTIDDEWISKLRGTYYVWAFGDDDDTYQNKKTTDHIKEYVKFVKKHKIIIKADKVVVEPSTFYSYAGDFIRTYVKFKIVSFEGNLTQDQLFFCENGYMDGLKKGKTLEYVFDVDLGTPNGSSDGSDYAIMTDYLFAEKY